MTIKTVGNRAILVGNKAIPVGELKRKVRDTASIKNKKQLKYLDDFSAVKSFSSNIYRYLPTWLIKLCVKLHILNASFLISLFPKRATATL